MKIYLCNYSNDKYKNQQEEMNRICNFDKEFDGVFSYNSEWLEKTDFYFKNKEILNLSRGAGYWLWKPFIILDSLNKINDGDAIFYMDSGDRYLPGIKGELLNILSKNNQCLVGGGFLNKHYTKSDCFYYMDCFEEKYLNSIQLEAGTLAFKKCESSVQLLNEWIEFGKDYKIITDSPNECGIPNDFNFIDHRHDQSIITNLAIKNNLGFNYSLKPFVINNIV